jgi:hypothetical protein
MSRDRHACLQQTHLELAEAVLAAVVGVRDERGHRHAPLGRILQPRLELGAIDLKMTMSRLFLAFLIAATRGAIPFSG